MVHKAPIFFPFQHPFVCGPCILHPDARSRPIDRLHKSTFDRVRRLVHKLSSLPLRFCLRSLLTCRCKMLIKWKRHATSTSTVCGAGGPGPYARHRVIFFRFFFPPIALRVSSRLFPFGPVFSPSPSRPPSTRNGKRLAMTNNLQFASTAFFHAEDANGTAGTHYANKSFAFIGLTQCTRVCVCVWTGENGS